MSDVSIDLNQTTPELPTNSTMRPYAYGFSKMYENSGITDIFAYTGDRTSRNAKVQRVLQAQPWPAVGKFLEAGQNVISLKGYSTLDYSHGAPVARTSSVSFACPCGAMTGVSEGGEPMLLSGNRS